MKQSIIGVVVVAAIAGAGSYWMKRGDASANTSTAAPGGGRGSARQSPGGRGFGGPRLPMTVELAAVTRADMVESLTVVGNLIGAATVEAGPKVSGRLESVSVRLGDRVSRGQQLAKVEDQEIQEQVKQAQASFDVAAATIRQREADLKLAQTNLERSRNLYERQLIPKQTYDDMEARYQAAAAQVDLARAQHAEARARLDELKITLANTTIVSPVSGFVGRRTLDPGAWVTPNSAFISVVDIGVVRLVANIVEKDLRRISSGMKADVIVDAYPGEQFEGRIAHVAPILDPSTRTAQIEVEIVNSQFRLKPGMYAKVTFTVERRDDTLVVPTNAVVDRDGRKGVYLPGDDNLAKFQAVTLGMIDPLRTEVLSGLSEGARIVTTGAAALREGDRIVLLEQSQRGRGRPVAETPASGPATGRSRGQ